VFDDLDMIIEKVEERLFENGILDGTLFILNYGTQKEHQLLFESISYNSKKLSQNVISNMSLYSSSILKLQKHSKMVHQIYEEIKDNIPTQNLFTWVIEKSIERSEKEGKKSQT
jgi:hypothetical protein